ncbi:MAG TPA: aminoacyl-tRNA hydrolase [Candidatus Moranbacteria bacterium]|nr:MAG: Peptidyl-tRNA hydrolase [Candidatus Moranbacteria bacterium GW2011_GWC2_45_10]KKT95263.1 MAG: Peptidyl-tRNA hydrolase [Parcubacteria group bacterium GW2011_GWC1_45_14]HAV10954.1 aminoacyl-tRNA hydrolase [Candidatus Moranbacteria bacterium]
MKLIIGLGNPGEKYEKTRHNAGFVLLDEIRNHFDFPQFKLEKKFNAEISEGILKGEKTILAKPQTFMNLSGKSVRAIMDFYKLSPADITALHDDLDIEIGKWKISEDSRAAGHNGVQSIFDHLETQTIRRIRLGVEKSGGRTERTEPGMDFVLKDFTKEEKGLILTVSKEIIASL